MPTDVAPAPDRSFPIEYQQFAGSRINQDFRGEGLLEIRAGGTAFFFSGKKRAFAFGRDEVLEFRPENIWNVTVKGTSVQFATALGESGRKNQPFVFFCRDASEAAAIAALLPATKDADFIAGREFAGKLEQLGAPSPWTSVTNLIVAANVIVFVTMGLLGAGWIEPDDLMPYIRFGVNRADVTVDGGWWRLVASTFLHFGVIHLLLNMWALFQAGHLAERLFGRVLYLLAYFGSGIAGSLATLLWHREKLVWSVGASGAVFGVYGALLGYMLREKHGLPKTVFQPLLKSTLAFAGYNLLYGFVNSNIDNAAHIGGLAGGIALGWVVALPVEPEARARLTFRRLWLGLAVMAGIVAAGVLLAPRFDYRLMDEVAWEKTVKAPSAREAEVMQHRQSALTTLVKTKDGAEAARWLADEAIPFYSHWRDDILALRLAPGRRTAIRRDAFANILRMKVDSYTHLLDALRRSDASGFSRFSAEEQAIAAEIKKLSDQAK